MNENLILLLEWTETTIHPRYLIDWQADDPRFISLQNELGIILQNFKRSFLLECLNNNKQSTIVGNQLVKASNNVYSGLIALRTVWNQVDARLNIKKFYLYVLNAFERLLEELGTWCIKLRQDIPITNFRRPGVIMELKGLFKTFLLHIDLFDIEQELITILSNGILPMIYKNALTPADTVYCRDIMTVLKQTKKITTVSLTEILMMNGFNLPEFYYYCVNKIKSQLENSAGLHQQLALVITEKDKLRDLTTSNKMKMIQSIDDPVTQLWGYLSEKERYLQEMLKVQRLILEDEKATKPLGKVRINLSVAQFALFIRLQMEKGILIKDNIGELYSFFATHFQTPQAMYISADSLRKKSTNVEFSTAHKLKGTLISMLNWLNENYNLSNYKDS